MVGKVIAVIGIVILLGLGVFIYQVATHPQLLALPSFFNVSTSSSIFNFSLSSSHGPVGPQGLPPVVPSTSTQSIITTPASSSQPVIDPSQIPAGFTVAQLSPYFHLIRFGGVTAGTSYYYGTITLYSYLNASTTVDITGWQIKSRNSGEYIPQAVNLYDASGLMPATDIMLHNGDTVSLYSSSAAINLRLNKCIGYVAHMENFNPALPTNCPYVDRSAIQNFTGACQNYIESLNSCQAPDMTSPSIPRTDYSCEDYLKNNFTYKSCFQSHVNDADFLSNQVWVWMGSNVVDPYHDSVKLFDKKGLLVDLYSY
jgi:hypothetical protein